MKNLDDIKRELREWVVEGIPETIKALKAVLPPNGSRYQDLVLIEGRLKEVNLSALRGVISNEDLQLAYNQIRAALLDIINGLEESDLQEPQPGASAPDHTIRTGNILYRIPDAMQLDKEHKCVVRVAVNEELLLENIVLDQDVRLQSIRISDVMLVQLIDPSEQAPFHIRSVNSPEQFVDEDTFTEWLFYVKPVLAGTFPLLLKVAVLELVNGKERQREIVLEETIEIVTESIPELDTAPMKAAAYQLNLSGAPADAPPFTGPSVAPSPQKSSRAVVGIIRVLAMVGAISAVGVLVTQLPQSNLSKVDVKLPKPSVNPVPEDTLKKEQPAPEDTPAPSGEPAVPRPADDTAATTPPATKPLSPRPPNPVTDMVRVRGGSFTMGCTEDEETSCLENELPTRQVWVREFFISATEVTRAQYVVFLNAYGSSKVKDGIHKGEPLFAGASWLRRSPSGIWEVQQGVEQLPATHITWYGAETFARFYHMRLPSEAEWEYAAKGGRTNGSYIYAGSDKLEEAGWYRANAGGQPHAVRMKKPNAIGLYDMSGNVWEWTADCKHDTYQGAPSDSKPWTVKGDCAFRVVRGGAFNEIDELSRVSARKEGKLDFALLNIGFRVVKD